MFRIITRFVVVPAIVLLLYSSPTSAQTSLKVAFPNLSFVRPVDLQPAGDGTNRLFVVEQRGVISVFENNARTSAKTVFLDIQDRVRDAGNEEGLLGLAFHPDYAENGFFYLNYTASGPRRTVIARYTVSETDPDIADRDSERIILEIAQPFSNHNGGGVVFGPDGYLYIGMGDGGSGGDPLGSGQDLTTLLGAMLRIDVDATDGERNYGIPPDNPFVGNTNGFREEIYAYGLRNPWRFGFDPVTDRLWAADVGQNAFEEVDIIARGKNYGWNVMEGLSCFNPPQGCDMTGLEPPIWEYAHRLGRSVTGGLVYRGSNLPELRGAYIYGDFVSGRIWALRYDGINPAENSLLIDSNLSIASFGADSNDELYICAFDGNIYTFEPTVSPTPWDVNGDGVVDILDLVSVGSQFGQRGPDLTGDVDRDGAVDLFDLVIVASHFGERTDAAAPSRHAPSREISSAFHRKPIRRALAELEAMRVTSPGAEIAIAYLRAWLSGADSSVAETKLLPNYPNPFNPETWLPYQLATDADVLMEIYDAGGKRVRQLRFGRKPAGLYLSRERAAHWDGRSDTGELVSSGLYFYRLRADDYTVVRRLVVQK